jgi:hypothetical protein
VNWSVNGPAGIAAAIAPPTVDARGAEIMLLCPRRRYGAMTRLLARHAREHTLSGATTIRVASVIAAALAGYFVVASSPPAMNLAGTPKLTSSETRLVTLSTLPQSVPPSIELKGITAGSGAEPEGQMASLQPTMRSEKEPTEGEMALNFENRTTGAGTNAMPKSNPINHSFAPQQRQSRTRCTKYGATHVIQSCSHCRRQSGRFPLRRIQFSVADALEKLFADQLHIARNEIFARRGRYFNDLRLSAHFANFAWYQPYAWHVRLNLIEQANVGLIRSLEAPPSTRSTVSRRPPT